MARKIPPLNPLRAFEVVARTKNLTHAARELHVGQSAVSKQLNVLEEYLGTKLFRRERRGITLTVAGEELAERIIPAFDMIAEATAQVTMPSDDNRIRVQTYTTFAAKWLIPRLEDFHQRYPAFNVLIINSVNDADFEKDDVDFSIQLGRGNLPGADVDFLFDDIIQPVCSPAFLHQHAPETRFPQAVLRTRLLVSHYRPKTDWELWARTHGYEKEIAPTPSMSFSSSVLTWQAAMDGLGVAMGQMALLDKDLADHKLVAPFELPVQTGRSFYLLRPRLQREVRKVRLFRDWIRSQADLTQHAFDQRVS